MTYLLNSLECNKFLFKNKNLVDYYVTEKNLIFSSAMFFKNLKYKNFFLKKFFNYFYLIQMLTSSNLFIKISYLFLDKKKKKKNLKIKLINKVEMRDDNLLSFIYVFSLLDYFFKVSSIPVIWKLVSKNNYLYIYITNLNYLNHFLLNLFEKFFFREFTGILIKVKLKNNNNIFWLKNQLIKILNEKK